MGSINKTVISDGASMSKLMRRQPIMRQVVLSLLPCVFGGVYFFGWRVAANLIFCCVVGFITEFIFCRLRKEPVSEAVFVSCFIFALILPPTVPWYVFFVGTVFAVMFGKEVFGGWARNIFNPAMTGRCFVYICFPIALTATWAAPAAGHLGGLVRWDTVSQVHSITSASPVGLMKQDKLIVVEQTDSRAQPNIPFEIEQDEKVFIGKWTLIRNQFFGRISGTSGVSSAMLICIGGIYLFYKKIASRPIILSVIITYAVWNWILTAAGVPLFYGVLPALFSGGFLFGAFYMATDPVSAPKTFPAKIIYGFIIATSTMVIRNFSIFNGGFMFSLLLANMFAPILDYAVKAARTSKAAKAEVPQHNLSDVSEDSQ